MDVTGRGCSSQEMMNLRRGPWTVDEDLTLINYIANHGEGRWNFLARSAGLKRTGKSCRLRWLNYLRPDVRRGNITLEEQLQILELHSRWGNRWSKIALNLPGRTDNEIKNNWRTRVQKQAKQLNCDVNSKQFEDTVRYLWMPRLVERIQAAAVADANSSITSNIVAIANNNSDYHNFNNYSKSKYGIDLQNGNNMVLSTSAPTSNGYGGLHVTQSSIAENSSSAASSDSFGARVVSPVPIVNNTNSQQDYFQTTSQGSCYSDSRSLTSPYGFFSHELDFQTVEQIQQDNPWIQSGDRPQNLWSLVDMCFNFTSAAHGSISSDI